MPFEVVKVFHDKDKVLLSGDSGPIMGIWQNNIEYQPLVSGISYQIELIILDEDKIPYAIHPKGAFRTRLQDDLMEFTGLIEHIYEDGAADVRISSDMLILLNKKNKRWKVNQWVTFQVPYQQVFIYPYYLNEDKRKFMEL